MKLIDQRIKEFIELLYEILMLENRVEIKFDCPSPRLEMINSVLNVKPKYVLNLPEQNEIEAKKVYYFYSIAHELRHLYQLEQVEYFERGDKENLELYPEEIKKIKEDLLTIKDEDEQGISSALQQDYNMRFVESDANAFGYLVMLRLFDISMDLECAKHKNGYNATKDEIKKIGKAIKEILTVLSEEDFANSIVAKGYDVKETKDWLLS